MTRDMPIRDPLADLLAEHLYDRGEYVRDWPADEQALHRDPDAWTDWTDRAGKVQQLRYRKAAAAIRANPEVLDDLCEYRARQINAERGEPRTSGMDDAALGAIARKLFGHPPPGIYGGLMLREAAASVALDHDERAETVSLERLEAEEAHDA